MSLVKSTIQITSVLGAFLVGIWLPLRLINYTPEYHLEIFFDLTVSLVAGLQIYLHLNAHKNELGKMRTYLRVGFLIDLICVIPFSLVILVLGKETSSPLLLFNLLAARHTKQIKAFLDQFDNLNPLTYRLTPIFILLPLLVHIVACGWIYLGSGSSGVSQDFMTDYIRSIYWSISTLTTVGYGDVYAKSSAQMIYASVTQLLGVGVFGYILSNVAGIIARSDAARENHMLNLDRIETYMTLNEIPQTLKNKVRSYYHYMWQNKKGYLDEAIIEQLPLKIQSELYLYINKPILQKVPFLTEAHPDLIEDLMHQLTFKIYVPGERVFRPGDPGESMYFIHKGNIEICEANGTHIATLVEGAFFGEMALLTNSHRSKIARASTFTELYVLNKKVFDRACKVYPEFAEHIHKVVEERKR